MPIRESPSQPIPAPLPTDFTYFSPEKPWLTYDSVQALWTAQGYGEGLVSLQAIQQKDNDANIKRALPLGTFELIKDTDNDGIPNNTDQDIDGDGTDNRYDDDVDDDGQANANDTDIDEDGIDNLNDPDIDGDGIANADDSDMDGDGVINGLDTDMDGDGTANSSDSDQDADSISDNLDTVIANADDLDGDGIENPVDDDADGDGVDFRNDAFPDDHRFFQDADGDGNGDTLNVQSLTSVNITLDDVFTVSPSDTLLFDPMNNAMPLNAGDELQLVNVTSAFGQVSVTPEQKIHYQAPSTLPQKSAIQYQIMDQSGGKVQGILELDASTTAANAPVFGLINPVEINAQSKITPLNLTPPTATDSNGNPATVSLETDKSQFFSGCHLVYWRANDVNTGTSQYHVQRVNIHPQIDFKPKTLVYEGGINKIHVHLSGDAPNYPFSVPIQLAATSSADASDFGNTFPINLTFNQGRTAQIELDVLNDGLGDNNETFSLQIDTALNTGHQSEQALTIIETEIQPHIQADIVNLADKSQRHALESFTNQLSLKAHIEHPDTNIQMNHNWSHKPPGATSFNAMTHGPLSDADRLTLEPNLATGLHQFQLSTQDASGTYPAITRYVSLIVNAAQTLSNADTDEDGIADVFEGTADDDGDLIPNYLDDYDGCDQISTIDTDRDERNFLVQVENGHCLQVGEFSIEEGSHSPVLTSATSAIQNALPLDNDPAHQSNYNSANLLNFTVNGLQQPMVKVVLPVKDPIRNGGVFRKYTSSAGWFDFVESGNEQIRFAQGSLGVCPPPGAPDYQDALIIGAFCIELTLEDGGIHDNDGAVNGKIDDPGYFSNTASLINIQDPITLPTYNATSSETQYVIQFDACNYIADCTDISVASPVVSGAASVNVSGTNVSVTFNASTSDINRTFSLSVTTPSDAASTSVNLVIDVPAPVVPTPVPTIPTPVVNNEEEGEGRLSLLYFMLFGIFYYFRRRMFG